MIDNHCLTGATDPVTKLTPETDFRVWVSFLDLYKTVFVSENISLELDTKAGVISGKISYV